MSSQSSEFEPLIETNNPFYNEIRDESNTNLLSKPRTYSKKTIFFFIALLILTAVLIYEVFPRNGDSSSLPTSNYNWLRAEQGHTHAAHIPKSWDEKEECIEDHPFVLTLALKQQNTDGNISIYSFFFSFLSFVYLNLLSIYNIRIFAIYFYISSIA